MATVIVATAAKVQSVEDASIVGLEVDGSGHLIATMGSGDIEDIGAVSGETPDASETVKGILELATEAEVVAGVDTNRAVTPQLLKGRLDLKQGLDSDLTAIAGLSPANDDILQRKSSAWVNRTMTQLATDLIATGSFSGVGGTTTYIPFKTVGPTGSGADYIVDGTNDHTEVQNAINALTNGGMVLLAPGSYNFADSVDFAGNDTYDAPTKGVIGAGMHSTKIICASNVDGFSITGNASVVLKDMEIQVTGTGNGITSTMGAGTPDLYQAFWNSLFENLYFTKNGGGSHTGWAINMGAPFRSRFANIEIFNLHNGMKFYSQNAAFNPGDFTIDRAFIELDSATGSVGLHLSSPVSNSSMNQMTFNMVELIDNASGGTGILLDGVGETNHNIFTGINIEQFDTVINVDRGVSNRFDLNYVESTAGGTFFKFGANGGGNRIRHAGMVYVGTKTNVLVNDANTWADNPNSVEDFYVAIESGGVLNATKTAVTKVFGMRGYNNGTLNNGLEFQRQAWNPAPVTLTEAATIATDASQGNHFRVTLTANRTLGIPTSPKDGQKAVWEIIQGGSGSYTLTITTGSSGAFAFGTDITGVTLSTTVGKKDYIGAVYNAASARWHVIALSKGY